jgi:hypothetical protein
MRDGNARTILSFAIALRLTLGAHDASAQAAKREGATAQAAAEALFVEAKELMGKGEYGRACAKLAESERLDPAAGTLLNLADCYEKNGQLASAWVTFREARTAATRIDRAAWAEQAAARARLIEPRLPTLAIAIDLAHAPEGIEITRDGVVVARSAWGSAIPVDPSTSRIEARAPHKKAWTAMVTVDADHPHVVLTVPPLEDTPPDAAAQYQPRRPLQKPISLALLGGAAVSVGLGAFFGITAITKNNKAAALCPNSPSCTNPEAVKLTNDASTAATVSTIAFVAGGALLVAGAYLFVTAPSQTAAPAVHPEVAIGHGAWSASLVGRF